MPDYSANDPRGWCGNPARGAALGRPTIHEPGYHGFLHLQKVRIDFQGYDKNGTYFGSGEPLYWCASPDCKVDFVLRAPDRNTARERIIKAHYPKARIKR